MACRSSARGFTLIEALLAMAVVTIGAAGMMSLLSTGLALNGDARRMTRAVAIAQDLMNQIELWPYNDSRLAAGAKAGDDITDDAGTYETSDTPVCDHSDADLGTTFMGIPTAELGDLYQRYWNVAYVDDSNLNSVSDGVRVAVIVRWRHGSTWRRVVLTGFKPNTVD